MRIIVCGGRNFNSPALMDNVLSSLNPAPTEIIHGAAKGADTLANKWGIKNGITTIPIPAEWDLHGKSAGPIRNRKMAEMNPALVVAFPGGAGTKNMINTAKSMGIKVLIVSG